MASFIEELPEKMKKILKETSLFLKKSYQDYQTKKAIEEAKRKKLEEINSTMQAISVMARKLHKEDNSLIEQRFKYYPVASYEEKTVIENEKEVTKMVPAGQDYFPVITYQKSEKLGTSGIKVYGEFYELQFYGNLDDEIKTNLTDHWKDYKSSFANEATTFVTTTQKGEKKMIFALVSKETGKTIQKAKFDNIIF